MTTLTRQILTGAVWVLMVAGCQGGSDSTTGSEATSSARMETSLYHRLGGETAIRAVVDQFVANVAADERINKFFAATDLGELKKHLVNQIGQASGGPQKYTGRDMKTAHAGMGVGEADFNALVEDLVKALDQFRVPEKEKGELLALLDPMKGDIVEK
ncbi:MAG TPA: group 1 truncated hemoglobin [Candidatus Limnocylindria bacterium]|nr:group 1 truncated hemoglobin [Candidatus Limnocylindria bacterium]